MSNIIEEKLRDQLRSWGASLVGGQVKFDDPAKDAAYRAMLEKAGGTIEEQRSDGTDDLLARRRQANALQSELLREQSQIRLNEGEGLAALRERKAEIDSSALARDQASTADQQLRILQPHYDLEAGLDRSVTDRMDRNIAYFDRNDERKLALEREKLAAQRSGQVMNLIGNLLRGAAVFAL